MDTATFHNNPHYVEYTRLLRELHLLAMHGERDSEAEEALRDEMDLHWSALNDDEITRVKIMSADLRMIEGKEIFRQVPESERALAYLGPKLQEAITHQDWVGMLALLRTGPEFLASDQLAILRCQSYDELGHPEIALLFAEYAYKVAPQHIDYLTQIVGLLRRLNRTDEIIAVANTSAANEGVASYDLLQLASELFQATRTMSEQQTSLVLQQVSSLINIILNKEDGIEEQSEAIQLPALVIMGECCLQMNDMAGAQMWLDRALAIAPEAGDIWALRGLTRFTTDPERAASDFERAIERNTHTISPYLFLSSRALHQKQWHKCLQLCQRALTLTQSRTARARLLSWSAIAQYELGLTPQQVRRTFETARSLDPINEAVRRNYRVFEQSVEQNESPDQLPWQVVLTQQEMRESQYSLAAA